MGDATKRNLESILHQGHKIPSVIELIRSLGLNEQLHKGLLDDIKNLEERNTRERDILIAKKELEKGNYISAYINLVGLKVKDDQIYGLIGDKIIEQGEKAFDDEKLLRDEFLWRTSAFVYCEIDDEKLRKEKLIQGAQKIIDFSVRRNLASIEHWFPTLSLFYHYAKEDYKVIELGDKIISRLLEDSYFRRFNDDLSFSNAIMIYNDINDKDTFERKIRETLKKVLSADKINFEYVEKCLNAGRRIKGEKVHVNWKKEELNRISKAQWKQDPEGNILGCSALSPQKIPSRKKVPQKELEALADAAFEREIKKPKKTSWYSDSELDRNMYGIEQLYDRIKGKIPSHKWLRLGKRAERQQEFSFAIWAYKKINSEKDMDRVIKKAIEYGDYQSLPAMLETRIIDNKVVQLYHPILQKGLVDGFYKALKEGKVMSAVNLSIIFLMPDLIGEEYRLIGDDLLKKAKENNDFGTVKMIYERTEQILTGKKLEEIAAKLKSAGEMDLSNAIFKASNYVASIGKDKFALITDMDKRPENKMFWRIRNYLENSQRIRETDDAQYQKRLVDWNKNELKRISKLAKVKDIEKVKQVFDDFRHYKKNKQLKKLVQRCLATNCEGEISWALKSLEDEHLIQKVGRHYLENKEYGSAKFYLSLSSKESAVNLVSESLRKDILENLRQDLKSGLEFMLTVSGQPKLAEYFDVKIGQNKETAGHLSDVSSISFNSEKLLGHINIVVKVDKHSPTGAQMLDKEALIYKTLGSEGISVPKIIKIGKVNDFYVGVLEYLPGLLLSQQEISQETILDIVKKTLTIQKTLDKKLTQEEKGMLTEANCDQNDFYSKKIAARFKEKLGIDINEELLIPLDAYLLSEGAKKSRTVVTDRNPTNIIYNDRKNQLQMIDFNAARVSLPQEDWAFFIDDPRLKTSMTRDEMIKAYATSQEDITTFHYIATYRNLIQTAMRWVDEPQNKQISYHNLQRAKESAKKIGLTKLIEEIEQKIEPLFR